MIPLTEVACAYYSTSAEALRRAQVPDNVREGSWLVLVGLACEIYRRSGYFPPKPAIVVDDLGFVQFDWATGTRELMLTVTPRNTLGFIRDGDDEACGECPILGGAEHLCWLMQIPCQEIR